ncbi:Serine/threonine-protein phosphatase 2A activator 2 [Neolecta irregularis DAH-3]|uniref:Serine/threonine-protein phosphatase 2A activator n=1 Tax=Neolecta irregularis (strain DAH-3) TaxID=1198029 RepID=A0A1U7LKG1_NEOID|nr:Serine/threonine-protein phosphatase 2A activator 2 [Neolecta irregularis DAH-3]|eukprot:OLL23032.1 Serine/threonine-protein phosphatase 2A activator 2 [Neolecta irregularis DAH-3]
MTQPTSHGHLHKKILTSKDLEIFKGSETYFQISSFLEELNESVKDKGNRTDCYFSKTTTEINRILQHIEDLVGKHPPEKVGLSRFGNTGFHGFYDELNSISFSLQSPFSVSESAKGELSEYLAYSFGNRTRIDYGSGHELNFLCYLLCLRQLDQICSADNTALVLGIFTKYLSLMRLLQQTYWLEPAGSHGVWGLDDYHFLPFVFGSSQLRGHKYLRPKSIHDPLVIEAYAKEYIYIDCISFINSIKSASLRWHSPMLDDISAAKSWEKVNSGMIKMYRAEVLGKLPVMQHFRFGELLKANENMGIEQEAEHVHGWGDCCGIKVPSAVAAKKAEEPRLRRLPFD